MKLTKEEMVEIFESIDDPEVNIDIYTMGLIYDFKIEENKVWVLMTFTTPTCPYGPQLVDSVKEKVHEKGIEYCDVDITFNPAWKPSEELKEILGLA